MAITLTVRLTRIKCTHTAAAFFAPLDEMSREWRVAFILDFASGEIANDAPREGGMLPSEEEWLRVERVEVEAMADEPVEEGSRRRDVEDVVERSMAGEVRMRAGSATLVGGRKEE